MRKQIIRLVVLLAFSPILSQAQDLRFDLGDKPNSLPAVPSTIKRIILENAFPNRLYGVVVTETPVLSEPLNIKGGGITASGSGCPEFIVWFKKIKEYVYGTNKSATEKGLKDTLRLIESERKRLNCSDETLITEIAQLKSDCIRIKELESPLTIKPGFDYSITVVGTSSEYKFLYKGKTKGRWLVNYGFLFSSKKLEPDQFFLDKIGTDSFKITPRTANSLLDLRFTPTIFFCYYLDKNLDKPWNKSLSAGLGVNTSSPVVSLGYNMMYQQNIGFSAGIVFYEQQRINSRYKVGQILKENLEDAQLYEKSFFKPNLFFAINIRLGESPFKNNSDAGAKKTSTAE
jgi:hypothetical protein